MDINKFRDELNTISPSFCVAKWKQVTLHLQTGHPAYLMNIHLPA